MPELKDAYALIVGIANYARIRALPYVDDARDIAALLKDPEFCGYGQVSVLENDGATRDAILAELDRFASLPPGSTVFIYFSGHGGSIDSGEYRGQYLLPVETVYPADSDLAATAISGEMLTRKLLAIKAERLTVILDCCHAGGIGEPRDLVVKKVEPGLPDDYLERLKTGRGRVIIAAARSTEPAWVVEGNRHGTFTRLLLEALKGGARGSGGVIRVAHLFDYIQEKIAGERPPQHPVFKAEFEENFPIALHLGGKAGSGETVAGGLAVLVRLIRDVAPIRDSVATILVMLDQARKRIGTVVGLKQLHDALHDLQVNRYDQIVLERTRFPDDEGACQSLRTHSIRVTTGARQLRPIALRVYPDKAEATWVDELDHVALDLNAGVKGRDLKALDGAIRGLNEILFNIPSKVNTDLLGFVAAMNLRALFPSLIGLRAEMEKQGVAADDVRRFTAGGLDLGRLDRDLDDLMAQHDRWQAINSKLHRIEGEWRGSTLDDLDFSLGRLCVSIRGLRPDVADVFGEELDDALGEVEGAVGEPGDSRIWKFRRLRNASVQWFHELDKMLLERCNELPAIDAALTAVLAAVQGNSQ